MSLRSFGILLIALIAAGGVWIALAQQPARETTPVTDAMLTYPQSGEEWISYGGTPGETRYSPLDQINDTNVGRLGLKWSYEIETSGGGQESTPLIHNGVIYSITNWSVVFAVDARTGEEIWRWDPVNNREVWRMMEGGVASGGTLTTAGNLVFQSTPDGKLLAWKADDGEKLFEVETNLRSMAPPVTFILDGQQYIAVQGGVARGQVSGFGAAKAVATDPPPHLMVFALDATGELPQAPSAQN